MSQTTTIVVSWAPPFATPPVRWLVEWLRGDGEEVCCVWLDGAGRAHLTGWHESAGPPALGTRSSGRGSDRAARMYWALRASRQRWSADRYIFFDSKSLLVATAALPRTTRIFYCLDVLAAGAIRREIERMAGRRAAALVVSEPAKLTAWPAPAGPSFVVRNTIPLRVADDIGDRRSGRATFLSAQGIGTDARVVVHAGGVASDFGLEVERAAMALLDDDVHLVLLGNFRSRAPASTDDRVHIVGAVNEDTWRNWLAVAAIGLALWTPTGAARLDPLAGWNTPASWNRIYWYLAAGLPAVVGGHRHLRAFADDSGSAVYVDDISAETVAQGVRQALARAAELSAAARSAFRFRLNLEKESEALRRYLTGAWTAG